MCLTCGYLGCGRKFYDGSGGNNHTLNHCTTLNHPVAVKLGTITAEGTASVYCYKCDTDVLDPNLKEHLNNFGIKI